MRSRGTLKNKYHFSKGVIRVAWWIWLLTLLAIWFFYWIFHLERKKLESRLRRSCELTKAIIDNMNESLSLIDVRTFNIIAVNKTFLKEYGYSDESEVLGRSCYEITHHRTEVCAPPDDLCPLVETVTLGEHFSVEHTHYCKGGEKIYVEVSTAPIRNENGNIIQVVHMQRNVTERKLTEEKIKHQAYHDALTNLPNRRFFEEIISVEIAKAHRNKERVAILCLDLDRFKVINDTMGHEAGDNLLKQVSKRLKACLRESDIIARMGGDEFSMLLADIGRVEDVASIAQKIVRSFEQPYQIGDDAISITTSVGICIYPDDGKDIEVLLHCADMAMYRAKRIGRNNYQFCSN